MLFYIILAISCIIVAAVVVRFSRSVAEIGKAAFHVILPSSKGNIREPKLAELNSNLSESVTPWGWANSGELRHAVSRGERISRRSVQKKSAEKVPWGWPGSESLQRSNRDAVTEGIEKSALVASVKSMLNRHGNRSTKTADDGRSKVGWPYREESFEFSGRKYKLTRKPRKTLSRKGASKPWGW